MVAGHFAGTGADDELSVRSELSAAVLHASASDATESDAIERASSERDALDRDASELDAAERGITAAHDCWCKSAGLMDAIRPGSWKFWLTSERGSPEAYVEWAPLWSN